MSEWISVKDQLPELSINPSTGTKVHPSDVVLVFCPDQPEVICGYLTIYRWEEYTGILCECWQDSKLNVTYWMPLPAPPLV